MPSTYVHMLTYDSSITFYNLPDQIIRFFVWRHIFLKTITVVVSELWIIHKQKCVWGGRVCSLPGLGPMIRTDNLQHPLLTESPTIIRLSASHCAGKASGVYPVKQFLSNLYVLFLAGKCCHIQRPGFSYQISSMSPPENSYYTIQH